MKNRVIAGLSGAAFVLALAGCATTTIYEAPAGGNVEMPGGQGVAAMPGMGAKGADGSAGAPGAGGDHEARKIAMETYLQCLKDEGLEIADDAIAGPPGGPGHPGQQGGPGQQPPQGGPGQQGGPAQPGAGGAPAQGDQAEGDRAQGDHADRLAQRLGQDPEDPAWIAANESCVSVLEDAKAKADEEAQGAAQ